MTGLQTVLRTHPIAPAIRVRPDDGRPRMRHLMTVSLWAALLGVVGLAIGLRGLIGVLAGDAAHWYEPTITTLGVVGIALTVGGFATVHKATLSWALMGAASATLVAALATTIAGF